MFAEPNCNVRQLRRPTSNKAGQRLRANMPARIKVGPKRASCTVTDMSASGACLTFEGPLDGAVELWLVIENMPPIAAKTAWRKSNRVGVRFDAAQEWVHQVHKNRYDPAAWLDKTSLN